jgi:hypothetical protein
MSAKKPATSITSGGFARPADTWFEDSDSEGAVVEHEVLLFLSPGQLAQTQGLAGAFVAGKQLEFCSCFGTAHFDLPRSQRGLSFAHRGWVGFHTQSIFEPGEPQCENACGIFRQSSQGVTDTPGLTNTVLSGSQPSNLRSQKFRSGCSCLGQGAPLLV